MITLTFPFAPVAWQRVQRDRRGTIYVPKRTRSYKADVALWASKYVKAPITGPIKLTLHFFMARPKKPTNLYPRGDIDNYAKGIQDALNGVVFVDDSQIVELTAKKMYDDPTGAGPRITLLLEEI
jgi:Holliday junction resolvase RusA-like endonuclease